ncbi:hypothetical protein [Halorubrum salipaludis]|uniref:hypothetical protein n=1 Tax=Halorubrum salipaludis TaxID=2032630 RepID=UPI001181B5F3|nr:hypothetical protein [Halorubrum salipaludis]
MLKALGKYFLEPLRTRAAALYTGVTGLYNNRIREYLPRRDPIVFNGVIVDYQRSGDFIPILSPPAKFGIPHDGPDYPTYESSIVRQLNDRVTKGDSIVIVGGGLGVTAVTAAKQVGRSGQVIVFEGDPNQVDMIKQTAMYNDVADRIHVKHAIIAEAISLKGESGDAPIIPPLDLPECDLLELDCEGAETQIIQQLPHRPETIIVETHGHLGASTQKVRNELIENGYTVVSDEIAEDDKIEMCEEKDIRVLTAHNSR